MAPRHLKAIKDTGNNLLAALDKNDSVGILDNYFPRADFFTEFERFDRHCEKLRRSNTPIHYVSVCSPNYLHDAHCRFGLRIGADVICEKPVVLNPWNVDALADIEKETGKKIFTVLQLRHHPAIIAFREKLQHLPKDKIHLVNLQYITPRGNWYHSSWKGDVEKSGGIATNIGIHFFDILLWLFGDVKSSVIVSNDERTASGKLQFANAEVNWLLSIDINQMPDGANRSSGSYRQFVIDGESISLDDGFTKLHTRSYEEILKGNGIPLSETKQTIQLLQLIREKMTI